MAMGEYKLDLPDDVIQLINELGKGTTVVDSIKTSIAISLFVAKSVSLARAAEIANLSINDFIYVLQIKKIPWSEYTEESLNNDKETIADLLREKKNDYDKNSL
ncbi:UPF0175 family protein [Bacillus sp. MM2020_1]|nr:UPF0175 family protein [Bacillus sp. MM2020_1]